MTEVSIDQAAERIIHIETEAPVPGCAVNLLDGLGDPHLAAWFQDRTTTAAARLYDLSDVVLDSHLQVLLQAGRPIPESLYMVSAEEYETVAVHPDRQTVLDGDKRYIIASNRSSNNYYHWMVQTLPGIFWGTRTRREGQLGLLSGPLSRWQEASLDLLGLADIPRVVQSAGQQYFVPHAQFNDFVCGRLTYCVSRAVSATFQALSAGISVPSSADRMIYVARLDSAYRPLLNEHDVIAFLQGKGVRIIVPGAHDLADQIRIFRGAEMVIGPHGAGLSNIGFCRPGTTVYEFLPRHFPNACFDFLAQSMGLHYHAAIFDGPPSGSGSVQDQGWHVDMPVFRAQLSSLFNH